MMSQASTLKPVVLLGLLLLQSCGGGSEYAGIDRGGEKPDLSVTGPINGFGSVIVDGVRYNTDNAEIYIRGELADEYELDVGDYVTVIGRLDADGQGIAQQVHFQPKVTGAIEFIEPLRNRIWVLGQVIQLVQNTTYSASIQPRNIDALAVGQQVSVSGITGSDGVIRATRVERDASSTAEVAGAVSRLNLAEQVFYLNELRVEYAAASGVGELSAGQPVVVRGVFEDRAFHAFEVTADNDYRKLGRLPSLEFRGYVTNLNGARFSIEGVPAQVSETTEYIGGSLEEFVADSQVRARGAFDSNYVLHVDRVEFVGTPVMQSFGEIEMIALEAADAQSRGTITVGDFTFELRADTTLVGDSEERISFDDLRIGDRAYVSAYSKEETLIASSIAIDNRDTYTMSFEYQGQAAFIDFPRQSFFMYGRHVLTNENTKFSEATLTLTAEEFYRLLPFKNVRVRGEIVNGTLIADTAQLSGDGFVNGAHTWGGGPYCGYWGWGGFWSCAPYY